MSRLSKLLLLALFAALVLAACGDSGTTETTDAPAPTGIPAATTEAPTTEPPTTGPPTTDASTDFSAAQTLFDQSLQGCDPTYFDGSTTDPTVGGGFTEEVSPGVYRYVDAEGTELLVDVNAGVVTGPDGPEGHIGQFYSFWCPPEVFVGTVLEGENGDDGFAQAAEFFFTKALPACNAYSLEIDGTEPFDGSADDPTVGGEFTEEMDSGHPGRPPLYLFVDSAGTELLVDVAGEIVTGIDGEEGAMPRPYAFWCSPEVFVGTLDE
ncbi:MAG: hypothetical protein JJE47_15270 [Acidimicrobiia bacterium]|nr:hypothetical protein [Acidimicrobiia bacterium]